MLERVMMIAGEVSGDLHGEGVVRELKGLRPGISVSGIGGDLMRQAGMEVTVHIERMSVMGFAEVIRHLPEIRRVEQRLEQVLEQTKPQVVVLIDYPGFNLRFARKAKEQGCRVLYYISPQVWAWNRGRVRKIRDLVDEMNVVFPFEVDLYREEGVPVTFVGHPLLERLKEGSGRDSFLSQHGLSKERRLVALFPGSRRQEVTKILPTMLEAAAVLQSEYGVQAAVGISPGFDERSIPRRDHNIPLLRDATYGLMEYSDAVMVTSGTATLETAWFGTPMVVVYRTSFLTYLLARMLVRIPHIGLVNVVRGKKVVPELIQNELTVENLVRETGRFLSDPDRAETVRQELSKVRRALGAPGASRRVAENIVALGEAA